VRFRLRIGQPVGILLVVLGGCGSSGPSPIDASRDRFVSEDGKIDGTTMDGPTTDGTTTDGATKDSAAPVDSSPDGSSLDGGAIIDAKLCAEMCRVALQIECGSQPTMSDCVANCLSEADLCTPQGKAYYDCLVATGPSSLYCDQAIQSVTLKLGVCTQESADLFDCLDM